MTDLDRINREPKLKDLVETSYSKAAKVEGWVVEIRVLSNGVRLFKVKHSDGFENLYMEDDLVIVGEEM